MTSDPTSRCGYVSSRYSRAARSATVPAPLQDREFSTTEFVGQRHQMLTFVYTNCTTVCPGLTATLRHVQADSVEEGCADEVALLPTTFDPALLAFCAR